MAVNRLSRWIDGFEGLSRPIRVVVLVAVHALIFCAAYFGAFAFRFDFRIDPQLDSAMWQGLPLLLAIKLSVFALLEQFRGWWKYVSLYDVVGLAHALAISSAIFLGLHTLVVQPQMFPRSIYLLDFTLSLVLLAGARGSLRLVREALAGHDAKRRPENLLIVGAGDPGDLLVREITRADALSYRPVAILDDDPNKWGLRLHGIPVDGPLERLQEVVDQRGVEAIIIALPPDQSEKVRHVVDLARRVHIQPRILPAVETVLHGDVSLRDIRDVSITDLLGRDPIDLDMEALGRFLQDRTVLVTGAGGSIGSELCRQIMRFSPRQLILVDCAETPLFAIHRELSQRHQGRLQPCIADVADERRMERVFDIHQPQVVLHAAAYKHVPLMEENPAEAVKNNVEGTRIVADLSARCEVEIFVLISTDKAVNPTSIMGATKRVTELYVQRLGRRYPHSRFCAVRFGNVLGSNGSVVPIFRQQIKEGGPVTVTHPEMTRYFMTIPEAVQLVLQAAAFDTDDDLFILDMGSPVRIADLAKDMIRLSGRTEEEIPIVYTGVRPGEKLYEELTLDEEAVDTTSHKKIFVGRRATHPPPDFEVQFSALLRAAELGDDRRVRDLLDLLIPGYGQSPPDDSAVDFGTARAAR